MKHGFVFIDNGFLLVLGTHEGKVPLADSKDYQYRSFPYVNLNYWF